MEFQPDVLLNLLQVDLNQKEARPLCSDTTVTEARKSALLDAIFKKWQPLDNQNLADKAIATFKGCNASCQHVDIEKEGYVGIAIAYAKEMLASLYFSGPDQAAVFGLHEMCGLGTCGPGSSLGTKRTDFLGKMFESELTVTDVSVYNFYKSQLSPRWLLANHYREAKWGGVELRSGSQLSTVPKNRDTDRTICTEPSLNMFFQLGAGANLERLLRRGHNIDLSLQPNRNKALARIGSVTGRFATIDLKSASDTISTKLVQYLLPRELFSLLDLIRSKSVKYPDGTEERLHMFSSMGNGFTFPLQTLIFATLVRAAYDVLGIPPRTGESDRNYSVFGDDIICEVSAYNFVCQVLKGCGFHVNDTKSFAVGSFRESCGGDYFKGFDIRAVYLKKVRTTNETYSAFNRLARWSAMYNISLCRSLAYLRRMVEFRPVPLDEQDTAGLKVPSYFIKARKKDQNGANYYTALVPKTRTHKVLGGLNTNSDGALVCAIGGYVRDNQVTLRSNAVTWKVVRRKTPCWDRLLNAEFTTRDLEFALIGVF